MNPQLLQTINLEHAALWRILVTLEKIVQELDAAGEPPDPLLFDAIFDYLRAFQRDVHFPREEQLMAALGEKSGLGEHELLARLAGEHQEHAAELEALRDQFARTAKTFPAGWKEFKQALSAYLSRKRNHIRDEDRLLFPLARERLEEADWRALEEEIEAGRDPALEEALKEEFRKLYHVISNYAPEPIGLGLERRDLAHGRQVVLRVEGLSSHYGRVRALDGIDLVIGEGELVALVGANGAGKTTLLRTLSGVQQASGGTIRFLGDDITSLPPDQRVRRGIVQVPEGRQVFGPMTVEDNLLLGGITRSRGECAESLVHMYDMFPILKQKRRDAAGTLSGGQQQMLAIARALMARPKLLLLDEPSMGLAPLLVDEIFQTIGALREQGITIFLVEQNAFAALSVADRGYVLETGRVVLTDTGLALLDNERVREAYLGM